MIKIAVTLLNLLVILMLQIFPGSVTVKMDVPTEVNAGNEFEVKITLNKGDLENFSRFQQNIPAGLTAVAETTSNADFSFTDKRVRLIWLRMPSSDEITITYRVKVDERLKGNFTLGGKFSYIDNNERKSVDISPVSITILPSSTVDPSLIVDIGDYEKTYASYEKPFTEDSTKVVCIRQKPYAGGNSDYIVNLLVSKENRQKFAKIEESVPNGYTAVALNPGQAIFTFKNQKAKFLWMNLPAEPYFMVSYRLIPKNQVKLAAPQITGSFSYLVEDKTISVNILEKDMDLASLKPDEVQNLVAEALSEPAVQQQTEPVAEKPLFEEKPLAEKKPGKKNNKPGKTTLETRHANMLEPEEGIYYRIQLAAGHKPVSIARYFKKFNLGKEVRREEHEGWFKYSIGSFDQYSEARDYRVHIWNTTPVKDAFVTAYNNGQRITVQEALMITAQKWEP